MLPVFQPSFDSSRDEPEFQQIVRDMEAKYQAEHERVREWMEENVVILSKSKLASNSTYFMLLLLFNPIQSNK